MAAAATTVDTAHEDMIVRDPLLLLAEAVHRSCTHKLGVAGRLLSCAASPARLPGALSRPGVLVMQHDSQFDYYGSKLATASSDRTVRVFSVTAGQQPQPLATLHGHEGPVWQVAWAHPK